MEQKAVRSSVASKQMMTAIDPKLEQIFNQSIRDQLNSTLSQVSDSERLLALRASIAELVGQILSNDMTHAEWVNLFSDTYGHLLKCYKKAELTEAEKTTSFINATGLVMSVDHAIHTIKDIYRIKAFIRGVHQAIETKKDNETIHIAYPACGPFAPLLLPLISHYSSQGLLKSQLKISLIDIQPGAVKALNQLINDLGISPYIHEVICDDVMNYQPDYPIDILVIEALQHGFSREGHLAFARHLLPFLSPDAIMVPEKISVTASLNIGQREYVDQWAEQECTHSSLMSTEIQQERTVLGEIFTLTLDKLRKLTIVPLGSCMELVECNQVQIPTGIQDISKKNLLLSVTATTFGNEQIKEYDSGISQPMVDMSLCIDFIPKIAEPDDLLAKSGERLKFYYKLTGSPSFLPTIA